MKKLFLLAIMLFYALPVLGQKNDNAFIKALNQTFDFTTDINSDIQIDTNIKVEYEDRLYWPGRVIISFTQEHIQGLKETAPLAKALAEVKDRDLLPEPNNFLAPLGIDYSLQCFKRCRWNRVETAHIEFIVVSTKPGQKVLDAIKDLKQRFPIKIESIDPDWFPDAKPGSWK